MLCGYLIAFLLKVGGVRHSAEICRKIGVSEPTCYKGRRYEMVVALQGLVVLGDCVASIEAMQR